MESDRVGLPSIIRDVPGSAACLRGLRRVLACG